MRKEGRKDERKLKLKMKMNKMKKIKFNQLFGFCCFSLGKLIQKLNSLVVAETGL